MLRLGHPHTPIIHRQIEIKTDKALLEISQGRCKRVKPIGRVACLKD